jgi:hypothetical protein
MKNYTILFLSILFLFSCQEDTSKKKQAPADFKKEYYFEFDEITHYKTNFNAFDYVFFEKDSGSIEDNFIAEVITGKDRPNSLQDTLFIKGLDTLNFTKNKIPSGLFSNVKEIFCSKYHEDIYGTMCIPKFRDILIFKKDSSIVGIAKICFECEQSSIKGSKVSTHGFGMSGDFEKLEILLKD